VWERWGSGGKVEGRKGGENGRKKLGEREESGAEED
jgi:hypothetical protein